MIVVLCPTTDKMAESLDLTAQVCAKLMEQGHGVFAPQFQHAAVREHLVDKNRDRIWWSQHIRKLLRHAEQLLIVATAGHETDERILDAIDISSELGIEAIAIDPSPIITLRPEQPKIIVPH